MRAFKNDRDLQKVKYGALLGIGTMIAGGAAEATVITSPSGFSQNIGVGSTGYTIATPGVTITNQVASKANGANVSYVSIDSATGFTTGRLTSGQIIAPGGYSLAQNNFYSSDASTTTDNAGVVNGLYGFSFVSGGKTNYGWVNLSITNNGKPISSLYDALVVTLNSFAYTTNGEFILAGGGLPPAPVPEAESVVMLAAGLGLMGLVAKRRRNQALKNASTHELLAA